MANRINENRYRNTVICVDSYRDMVMKGRIFNPFFDGSIEFGSVMACLLSIEDLLEQMCFPQAYEIKRSFGQMETAICQTASSPIHQKGEMATFELKIMFRQNASWQGMVLWKETGKEESFRSVLELLMLMHSALSENDTQ